MKKVLLLLIFILFVISCKKESANYNEQIELIKKFTAEIAGNYKTDFDIDSVRSYADKNINIDCVDSNDVTVLMTFSSFSTYYSFIDEAKIAKRKWNEMVSILLNTIIEKGIDINGQDKNGSTALMYAVDNFKNKDYHGFAYIQAGRHGAFDSHSSTSNARILIKAGADINIKDNDGNSALLLAMKKDDKDMIEFLIKNGADVKVKNKVGDSPLTFALRNIDIELARSFLDNGAKIGSKDIKYIFALEIIPEIIDLCYFFHDKYDRKFPLLNSIVDFLFNYFPKLYGQIMPKDAYEYCHITANSAGVMPNNGTPMYSITYKNQDCGKYGTGERGASGQNYSYSATLCSEKKNEMMDNENSYSHFIRRIRLFGEPDTVYIRVEQHYNSYAYASYVKQSGNSDLAGKLAAIGNSDLADKLAVAGNTIGNRSASEDIDDFLKSGDYGDAGSVEGVDEFTVTPLKLKKGSKKYSRDLGNVQETVSKKSKGLQKCIKRARSKFNTLSGNLFYQATIKANGRVSKVKIAKSSWNNKRYGKMVEKCIIKAIKGWRFAKVSKGNVTFEQVMVF